MFVKDCDNPEQSRKKIINEVYFPTNSTLMHEMGGKIKHYFLKLLSTLNKRSN
jgi:hypothetical protein